MSRLNTVILVLVLAGVPAVQPWAQATTAPNAGKLLPKRWLTSSEVENQYGLPLHKSDPVGEPPIVLWEYLDYIVYFERDRVLHSVRKEQ